MTTYICQECNFHNKPGKKHCESCNASLDRNSVIVQPVNEVVVANRQLPSKQLKNLGTSLVVSAVALLVEVGIIYLRRRVRQGNLPPLFSKKKTNAEVTAVEQPIKPAMSGRRVVSVYSERVVEERRWGRPVRRIVNRMAWRSEESIES
jgi:hypothetical protein